MANYVYAAFLGNLFIAISKFIAGFMTNSTTMISEGYHSLSDTMNQVLLAMGIRRSKRKANPEHPFGFSQVQFFWSLIVSIMIFGLAGTLSFVHGFERIFDLEHSVVNQDFLANYVVLVLSFIFEGIALFMAYKELKHLQHSKNFKSLRETVENVQNPVLLTVLGEDSLALVGIVIAFLATLMTDITHNPFFDGLGSLLIGCVLMFGAILLARENKGYLIGKSMSTIEMKTIKEIIESMEEVNNLIIMRTMILGPEDVIISLEINYDDNLTTDQLEKAIDDTEARLIEKFPYFQREKIFVEPN